jgi:signal transduction histidine kinase
VDTQLPIHATRRLGLGQVLGGATEVPLAQRLERATRSTERLAGLIDALLDVSRISSGTLSLNLQLVDLSEVARYVADGLLQEASTNLLSNAFRHAAGQPVDVRIWQEGGEARLAVEDRGPGIRKEDLERIFGRFERAASSRSIGGLGLALYVSREILQAHGGSIEARNRDQGGASFLVRLLSARGAGIHRSLSCTPPTGRPTSM